MTPEPYAAVDSGTLIIIDPCYLAQILDLTAEQKRNWDDAWFNGESKAGDIDTLPVAHAAKGLILCVGDDGWYSTKRIANFLLHPKLRERWNDDGEPWDCEDDH